MPTRNHIDLVGKTMRVLEILADSGNAISLKQISSEAQLVNSSAFRILYSLKELGYVAQADHSRDYSLTWKMHALRRRTVASATLTRVARQRMIRLRDTLNVGIWLTEWRDGAAVLVGVVEAPGEIHSAAVIGSICSMHATASGKAIAAHLPSQALRETLGPGKLTRYTRNTIASRRTLRKELEAVRRQGFAMNKEEAGEGGIAVASPIFDCKGKVFASIAPFVWVEQWNNLRQTRMISATISAAEGISRDLAALGFAADSRRSTTIGPG